MGKFKIDEITYSKSYLEQLMTLVKIGLYCILNHGRVIASTEGPTKSDSTALVVFTIFTSPLILMIVYASN